MAINILQSGSLILSAAILSLIGVSGCTDRLLPADTTPQPTSAPRIIFTEITELSGSKYSAVIERVDADGSSRVDLTDGVIGAPPGRAGAVFLRNEFNVWFSAIDGASLATPELIITGRRDSSVPPTIDPGSVALSPSGTVLTYTITNIFAPVEPRSVIVGVQGGIPVTLPRLVADGITPSFSPDGSRLAFYSFDTVKKDGSADLCVVNADGTELRILESGGYFSQSGYSSIEWSPSGDRLVFSRMVGNLDEVRVIGIDGSAGRTISLGHTPIWNPTGDSILFSYIDLTADLYLAAADGSGAPRQVTFTPSLLDLFPRYSPDGTKLLYTTYASPRNEAQGHLTVHDLSTGATKVLSETAFKGFWMK